MEEHLYIQDDASFTDVPGVLGEMDDAALHRVEELQLRIVGVGFVVFLLLSVLVLASWKLHGDRVSALYRAAKKDRSGTQGSGSGREEGTTVGADGRSVEDKKKR